MRKGKTQLAEQKCIYPEPLDEAFAKARILIPIQIVNLSKNTVTTIHKELQSTYFIFQRPLVLSL